MPNDADRDPAPAPASLRLPTRLFVFVRPRNILDGLDQLHLASVPEDVVVVVFDEPSRNQRNGVRFTRESIVLDYGQPHDAMNGALWPLSTNDPAELLKRPDRCHLAVLPSRAIEDAFMTDFVRQVHRAVPGDAAFALLGVPMAKQELDMMQETRTIQTFGANQDLLGVFTDTLTRDERAVAMKAMHAAICDLDDDAILFSRLLDRQLTPRALTVAPGLILAHLIRNRVVDPADWDVMRIPGPEGLVYNVNVELLNQAKRHIADPRGRFRLPSFALDKQELQRPPLPRGEAVVNERAYRLVEFPDVDAPIGSQAISKLNEWCSTRKLPLPKEEDLACPASTMHAPLFSMVYRVLGQDFATPAGYPTKATAKAEAAKLALIGTGILRISPQAMAFASFMAPGEKMRLRGIDDAVAAAEMAPPAVTAMAAAAPPVATVTVIPTRPPVPPTAALVDRPNEAPVLVPLHPHITAKVPDVIPPSAHHWTVPNEAPAPAPVPVPESAAPAGVTTVAAPAASQAVHIAPAVATVPGMPTGVTWLPLIQSLPLRQDPISHLEQHFAKAAPNMPRPVYTEQEQNFGGKSYFKQTVAVGGNGARIYTSPCWHTTKSDAKKEAAFLAVLRMSLLPGLRNSHPALRALFDNDDAPPPVMDAGYPPPVPVHAPVMAVPAAAAPAPTVSVEPVMAAPAAPMSVIPSTNAGVPPTVVVVAAPPAPAAPAPRPSPFPAHWPPFDPREDYVSKLNVFHHRAQLALPIYEEIDTSLAGRPQFRFRLRFDGRVWESPTIMNKKKLAKAEVAYMAACHYGLVTNTPNEHPSGHDAPPPPPPQAPPAARSRTRSEEMDVDDRPAKRARSDYPNERPRHESDYPNDRAYSSRARSPDRRDQPLEYASRRDNRRDDRRDRGRDVDDRYRDEGRSRDRSRDTNDRSRGEGRSRDRVREPYPLEARRHDEHSRSSGDRARRDRDHDRDREREVSRDRVPNEHGRSRDRDYAYNRDYGRDRDEGRERSRHSSRDHERSDVSERKRDREPSSRDADLRRTLRDADLRRSLPPRDTDARPRDDRSDRSRPGTMYVDDASSSGSRTPARRTREPSSRAMTPDLPNITQPPTDPPHSFRYRGTRVMLPGANRPPLKALRDVAEQMGVRPPSTRVHVVPMDDGGPPQWFGDLDFPELGLRTKSMSLHDDQVFARQDAAEVAWREVQRRYRPKRDEDEEEGRGRDGSDDEEGQLYAMR
ncbi:hypothetical protein GGF32_006151 [Allomyces javanicus]|nr:hypothetical protein GGF32_006151 [Allomyces javanicus]